MGLGWKLLSTLVVFLFLILYPVLFVFAAGIDYVTLVSPGNSNWTSQDNNTIAFIFYYVGGNETASCALSVTNSSDYYKLVGENSSVLNNTNTSVYSNMSIEEGERYWHVNCTNETSVQGSYVRLLYVDRTNPIPAIVVPENISYNYNPPLNFSYMENNPNTCWYSLNETANVTLASCNTNGTVLVSGEGGNNVRLCMNDTAGNEGCNQIYYTKDITKPLINVQSPLNQTYNTSSIWFNVTASDDVDACVVNLDFRMGGNWNRTMSNSSENWNHYNNSMLEGPSKAIFYCNDTAGNWNWTSIFFSIDTTPPTVNIVNPPNATTSNDSFYFVYSGGANCSWYSVDGNANVTNCSSTLNPAGYWSGTFAALSDGQHNATVWANDSVGNANSTMRYWIRDTTPPPVFIISPQNITYNTTNINLNVSSDGTASGWKYRLNSGNNVTFSPNSTITAQYGSNTLLVYVNDSAGNVNESSITFYLNNTAPKIEYPGHYPTGDGGWGENHTFYVNCSDADGQNISLYLWYRKGLSDQWMLLGNQTCSGNASQTYSFLVTSFTCSNVTAAGENSSYKFNASDSSSLTNETSPQNLTIAKDDVSFQPVFGNNSVGWRNETSDYDLYLVAKIYDTDKGQYLSEGNNATIWVTKNASNPNSWDSGKNVSVYGEGFADAWFINESWPIHKCNYTVGVHNWTVGITGDNSCYKATNSSMYNLTLYGDLRPRVTSPTGTRGFIVGDLINISGYVDDDCTERTGQKIDGASVGSPSPRYLIVGSPGSPTRYCTSPWNEGNGQYNCTWDSAAQQRTIWNITMSVAKGYYASNSTMEGDAFHLGTAPYLSSPSVTPSSEGWGYRFTFSVYFADSDSDMNNITLWKSFDNSTWQYVNMTSDFSSGKTITFYQRFSCSDSSQTPGRVNYLKFNTSDPYNYTNQTTPQTFNVTEDSVTITIDPSSNTNITMLGNATLRFRIRDDDMSYANPNGSYYPSSISGLVWITENGENYTRSINCTTNSSGYCQVYYVPNTSVSSYGTQYWKAAANNSCYEYGNSSAQTLEITNPVDYTAIYPPAITNGSSVNLSVLLSNHDSVWANVTLPNAAVIKIMLANNANTSFSTTSLVGRYNVTFYANGSSGTLINTSGHHFETFLPVFFNMSVIDYNSSGMNSSVTFYYENESIAQNSSVNGSHLNSVPGAILGIEIKAYSDRLRVRLTDVNISSETNKTFGMSKHTQTSGYLVVYGVNNTYNITNATVWINYDDIGYSDESNLKLYRCDGYNFTTGACSGTWTDATGNATQNTTGNYFTIVVASFSGFGVYQYTAPSIPGSYSPGGVTGTYCSSNWSCSTWSACNSSGLQTRVCTDKGTCKKPPATETRSCTYIPTCFDKMLDGGESDIDCGGPCGPCITGGKCAKNADCQSDLCENGVCKEKAATEEAVETTSIQEQETKTEDWIIYMIWSAILIIFIVIFLFLMMALINTGKKNVGNQTLAE